MPDGSGPSSANIMKLTSTADGVSPPTIVELQREDTRKYLAILIVVPFILIVCFSFVSFWCVKSGGKLTPDDVVKFTSTLLTPVVAIVGAVTGFYYGAAVTK
jgi:hypothetical protein